MGEPVGTAAVAAHPKATRLGRDPTCPAPIPPLVSTTRAKLDFTWRPRTDLAELIDAWTYQAPPTLPGRFGIRVGGAWRGRRQ
jgi:hypothetical protein